MCLFFTLLCVSPYQCVFFTLLYVSLFQCVFSLYCVFIHFNVSLSPLFCFCVISCVFGQYNLCFLNNIFFKLCIICVIAVTFVLMHLKHFRHSITNVSANKLVCLQCALLCVFITNMHFCVLESVTITFITTFIPKKVEKKHGRNILFSSPSSTSRYIGGFISLLRANSLFIFYNVVAFIQKSVCL